MTEIELLDELIEIKCAIFAHFTTAIESLIECGKLLKQAQAVIPAQGGFRFFCQSLPFGYRSAYHYMRLYDHATKHGLDTLLSSGIQASIWYKLPVDSALVAELLERAKEGKRLNPNDIHTLIQLSGIDEPTKALAWLDIGKNNPKHFAESMQRQAVTNPITGDDIPLMEADPMLAQLAANQFEYEKTLRQEEHIHTNSKYEVLNRYEFASASDARQALNNLAELQSIENDCQIVIQVRRLKPDVTPVVESEGESS